MTKPSIASDSPPRLPHEQDESSDSQKSAASQTVGRQAHADVMSGKQDTARGPEADNAYQKQKGSGAPGTKPSAPDQSGAAKPKI